MVRPAPVLVIIAALVGQAFADPRADAMALAITCDAFAAAVALLTEDLALLAFD